MREKRAERRIVGSLNRGCDGEPFIELDLGEQGQRRLGDLALGDGMRPVLIGEAGDLHHVVVAQALDRPTIGDIQDERHLPAPDGGGHHGGRDPFVALSLEHVQLVRLLRHRLAALSREIGRVALAHRALPRRGGPREVARVDTGAQHRPQRVVERF